MAKINISKSKGILIGVCIAILIIFLVFSTNLEMKRKLYGGGTISLLSVPKAENPFQINIFYFPKRQKTAAAVSRYLTSQGHLVNTIKASKRKNSRANKYLPSHFFFNKHEFGQAMEIKSMMEKKLGHPMSAYKFKVSQNIPSMIIIFTEAEFDSVDKQLAKTPPHYI